MVSVILRKDAISAGQDWDELARLNAEWAVLSDPGKKYKGWESEEYYLTGEARVKDILKIIKDKGVKIRLGQALDFGCGTGRLTRALAGNFNEVDGVDISEEMLTRAGKNLSGYKSIKLYKIDPGGPIKAKDKSFDFILSDLTLQHLATVKDIYYYLGEFKRVIKPGGVIFFQLPTISGYSVVKNTILTIRSRLYYLFTGIGLSGEVCFKKLKLSPRMRMKYLASDKVKNLFAANCSSMEIFDDHSINTGYLLKFRKV